MEASKRNSIGESSNNTSPPIIDLNILVVDDDATTLAVVSSMLQIWSYKVETAKNPLDALATLRMRNGLFDLVVTDLHMPFMNGFELQRQIDREFKLPVILMSADDQPSVLHESEQCGIVLYIMKPVSPNALKNLWKFANKTRNNKGKSVVIEELPDDYDLGAGFDRPIDHHAGSSSGTGAIIPRNVGSLKRYSNEVDQDNDYYGNKKGPNKKHKKGPHNNQIHKRLKKAKIVWGNSLHNRFLVAIRHLGYNTVPKRILEFMNVPSLTRENVASHLQKYRMFLKRVAENGVLNATKTLNDRFMRSSFAAGYPIELMLQHAREMYPHLFNKTAQEQLQQIQQQHQLPPIQQRHIIPSFRLLFSNNNNRNTNNHAHDRVASSSSSSSRAPIGLSTLLMENRPAPNILHQPILGASTYHTHNSNQNHNENDNLEGIASLLQTNSAQSRPGFVSRTFSTNTFGTDYNIGLPIGNNSGTNTTTTNNSGIGGGQVLTRFNGLQQELNRDVPAGINIATESLDNNGGFGFGVGGELNYNNESDNVPQVDLSGDDVINFSLSGLQNLGGGNHEVWMNNSDNINAVGNNRVNFNNLGGTNNNFGEPYVDSFLNQNIQQLPEITPDNDFELLVEDYASDLAEIAFGENLSRGLINNVHEDNNLANESVIVPNNPDFYTAEQPFVQNIYDNAQALLNDDSLPFDFPNMIDHQIPFQHQGLEQILQNNTSGTTHPFDNYFSGNQNPIECNEQVLQNTFGGNVEPLGIEQILQNNTSGTALPFDNYFSGNQNPIEHQGLEQIMQNNTSGTTLPFNNYFSGNQNQIEYLGNEQVLQNTFGGNVDPLGIEQILQNTHFNNSFSSETYFPTQFDHFTPLQPQGYEQVQPNPSSGDEPSFDAYVQNLIDQTPQQQQLNQELLVDPIQNIDFDDVPTDVEWDEFVDCLLNDSAPDLRE